MCVIGISKEAKPKLQYKGAGVAVQLLLHLIDAPTFPICSLSRLISMKKFLNKIKGDSQSTTSNASQPSSTGNAPAASGSGLQAGVEDPFAALRRYDTGKCTSKPVKLFSVTDNQRCVDSLHRR